LKRGNVARHGPVTAFGGDVHIVPSLAAFAGSDAIAGQVRAAPAPAISVVVCVKRVKVCLREGLIELVPRVRRAARVEEKAVVNGAVSSGAAVGARALP